MTSAPTPTAAAPSVGGSGTARRRRRAAGGRGCPPPPHPHRRGLVPAFRAALLDLASPADREGQQGNGCRHWREGQEGEGRRCPRGLGQWNIPSIAACFSPWTTSCRSRTDREA